MSQDVLSYQRVLDGVQSKADSLTKSMPDAQLMQQVEALHTRYAKLATKTKVREREWL